MGFLCKDIVMPQAAKDSFLDVIDNYFKISWTKRCVGFVANVLCKKNNKFIFSIQKKNKLI